MDIRRIMTFLKESVGSHKLPRYKMLCNIGNKYARKLAYVHKRQFRFSTITFLFQKIDSIWKQFRKPSYKICHLQHQWEFYLEYASYNKVLKSTTFFFTPSISDYFRCTIRLFFFYFFCPFSHMYYSCASFYHPTAF